MYHFSSVSELRSLLATLAMEYEILYVKTKNVMRLLTFRTDNVKWYSYVALTWSRPTACLYAQSGTGLLLLNTILNRSGRCQQGHTYCLLLLNTILNRSGRCQQGHTLYLYANYPACTYFTIKPYSHMPVSLRIIVVASVMWLRSNFVRVI